MSDAEIEDYYKKNIMTYKSIEIPLTDSQGSDLDEKGIEEVKQRLKGYLDLFKKNKDFDKVIEEYQADEEEKANPTTTTTTDPLHINIRFGWHDNYYHNHYHHNHYHDYHDHNRYGDYGSGDDDDEKDEEEPSDQNLRTIDANNDERTLSRPCSR